MRQKLARIISEFHLLNTGVVTIGLFIASVLSYVLQFFLGRLLSVQDYGDFGALLSVVYIIGVPATVFGISLTRIVSEFEASLPDLTPAFFKKVISVSILPGILVTTVLLVFRNTLSDYLNISNSTLIIVFAIASGFSFFSMVPSSFLQGLQKFKAFAVYAVIYQAIRVLLCVGLVMLGFRISGVFAGFALTAVFGFLYAAVPLKEMFRNVTNVNNDLIKGYIKKLFYFSVPVLLINLGLMMINNVDVLMVKRFFSADDAGHYVALVTVGKILLFGAGTIGTVMFPILTAEFTKKTLTMKKFLMFFVLQVSIVLVGVVAFTLLPNLLVFVFFGQKFLPIIEYIPLFSIFMGLYVLLTFMVYFFLSINLTSVYMFILPAAIVQFFLLNTYRDSIYTYIYINILTTASLLAVLLIYGYWQYLIWKKQKN